jgi:hypothetical protein
MTPFDFRYTVPFQAESAISAYSVMEGNGTTTTGGIVVIKARVYQAGAPPKVILINGPCDISSGKHGTASMGFVPTPILASGNIAAGAACGPSHNSASVSTGYPGFVALAAAANSKVWALRTFDGGQTVIGKLDGSLSLGGNATVSVWDWNGSAFADTGNNITAHDWLMKTGATAIASGKKVVCKQVGGVYIVTEAECA